jgi:hypothetical protein
MGSGLREVKIGWESLFSDASAAADAEPIAGDSLLLHLASGPPLRQADGVTYYEVELQLTAVGGKAELGLILSEQPDLGMAGNNAPAIVVDGWKASTAVLASNFVTLQTPSVGAAAGAAAGAVATPGHIAVRQRWSVPAADAIRVGDILVGLSGRDMRGLDSTNRQLVVKQAMAAAVVQSPLRPKAVLVLARGQQIGGDASELQEPVSTKRMALGSSKLDLDFRRQLGRSMRKQKLQAKTHAEELDLHGEHGDKSALLSSMFGKAWHTAPAQNTQPPIALTPAKKPQPSIALTPAKKTQPPPALTSPTRRVSVASPPQATPPSHLRTASSAASPPQATPPQHPVDGAAAALTSEV